MTALTDEEIRAQHRRLQTRDQLGRELRDLAFAREQLARAKRQHEAAWAVLDDRSVEYGRAVLARRWVLASGLQDAAVRYARARQTFDARRRDAEFRLRVVKRLQDELGEEGDE